MAEKKKAEERRQKRQEQQESEGKPRSSSDEGPETYRFDDWASI